MPPSTNPRRAAALHRRSISPPVRSLKAVALDSLLKTGAFSDFVIKGHGGREWKVHKAVICPQSSYFMRACSGSFTVRSSSPPIMGKAASTSLTVFQEAKMGCIDLSTDDVPALDALLTYMYNGVLTKPDLVADDKGSRHPARQQIVFHVLNVHILADKFDVATLTALTADEFMYAVMRFRLQPVFGPLLTKVLEETSP
ncbi:hypothetical protein B0A48_13783 [Cryoendolithus antarcticus]|uniref:BTB domain-containing protein n=1 Tax=Cryoendolithus antarcticus TaxID=1507870 RepID=A0A1V8SMY6_9PEZI|nr:hypothetical protein B0A48_13783 [Cryoendolithus antarcticus]